MKKHYFLALILYIVVCFIILLLLPSKVLATSIFQKIDVEDLDLSNVEQSKREELRETLKHIRDSVSSSSTDQETISNEDKLSINTNIVLDFYSEISDVLSNEEMAEFINDNKEVLINAGISKSFLQTSSKLLKNFEADTVIDIAKNDLELDKILEENGNDASTTSLLKSAIKSTSTFTKISIVCKLLFSNGHFRMFFALIVAVAIYSIFITSYIFNKAGKPAFITVIPIYRDIVHLKLCNFSPWVLLLIFVPFIGWLALAAIAVVRKI